MDEIDRRILIQLDKNARFTNTQIAKGARVSKDVVNYRIAKLQREGILTGFYTLPSLGKTGVTLAKFLVKFQSLGSKREQELHEWVSKNIRPAWFGSCDGTWNMIMTLSVSSFKELVDLIQRIEAKYGQYLSRKELMLLTGGTVFNEKYLYPNGEHTFSIEIGMSDNPEKLDKKDLKLIQNLADNARMNITEMAKEIDLTPEATAKRLKNLIRRGVIVGYKPRINFTKLGYDYFHVFVSTKNPEVTKEMMEYYKMHPSCIFVGREIGHYDMHLEFVIKGAQNFREVLKDLRDKFGDKVHEYEPLQIYTENKISIISS